jgi:hypothetical protein
VVCRAWRVCDPSPVRQTDVHLQHLHLAQPAARHALTPTPTSTLSVCRSCSDYFYANLGVGEWFWNDGSAITETDWDLNIAGMNDKYIVMVPVTCEGCGSWHPMDVDAVADGYLCGPDTSELCRRARRAALASATCACWGHRHSRALAFAAVRM